MATEQTAVPITPAILAALRKEIEQESNIYTRGFGWYLYWSAYFQMKGLAQ